MQNDLEFSKAVGNEDESAGDILLAAERTLGNNASVLSFLRDLAKIRTWGDFDDFTNSVLRTIIGFDQCYIFRSAEEQNRIEVWSPDTENDGKLHELLQGILPYLSGISLFNISDLNANDEINQLSSYLTTDGAQEFIIAPLSEDQKTTGAILFSSIEKGKLSNQNLTFLKAVTPHLSILFRNIILNDQVKKIADNNLILLEFSNKIACIRDKQDLFQIIDQQLRNLFPYEDFVICLINDDLTTHSAFLYNTYKNTNEHKGVAPVSSAKYSLDDGLCKLMMAAANPIVFDVEELMDWKDAPVWLEFWYNLGIKEMIGFPVWEKDKCIGFFYLYAKTKKAISNKNYGLLERIGRQLSVAIQNIKANEKIASQFVEINAYKQQLEGEKLYLEEQINLSVNQTELVGNSAGIKKVFYLIDQVAKSPSTVLILGETGTGKELVARAIHNNSLRKGRLMVKVNCATLPPNLIESELFGHEKGSFTGATDKRIGKFELANNGTLFLDEVGELPMDLQVKLLRVLQEKEIERIGGRSTIKIDVRIIAATNRDLAKEVHAGRFRSDLFYRLNVFPILIPPLRDRKEDIPALSVFFMHKSAKKAGKNVKNISQQVMKALSFYNWPGNVRELEHQIERCVLLTNGPAIKEIQLPKNDFKEINPSAVDFQVKTIHDNERDHILNILRLCNGKIAGVGGAAEILGIPATTLNSKIKKFKIMREHTLK